MKALFLTAGLATRFSPHTNLVPKPLLPFLGIPLYLYCYELLKTLGVKNYIFNLHHLPHKLKEGVLAHAEPDIHLRFSDETSCILGSGGAIKQAENLLDVNEDFILQNGDEVYFPYDNELKTALALHRAEQRLATIIVMNHSEAGKKFGAVWVDEKGRVLGFGKTPIAGAQAKHYIGTMILNARVIRHIPLKEINILYDTLLPLLKEEPVYAHTIHCTWYETGNEKDYIEAHQDILSSLSSVSKSPHFEAMLKKYLKAKPSDLNQRPIVFQQGSAFISSSAKLSGFIWLQNGSRIEDNTNVKDAVITENASVDSGQSVSSKLVLADLP
jgi:mannose-1-phosphate guanylyltransferase